MESKEELEELEEQKCRVCGCTWSNACLGGCWWVEDDLCSECEVQWVKHSKQIKLLIKERKKLRKLAGKLAEEKQNWKSRYEELNQYVKRVYQDY